MKFITILLLFGCVAGSFLNSTFANAGRGCRLVLLGQRFSVRTSREAKAFEAELEFRSEYREAYERLSRRASSLAVEIYARKHVQLHVDDAILRFLLDSSESEALNPSALVGELESLMNTYADEILNVAYDEQLRSPYRLVLSIDPVLTYAFVEVYRNGRRVRLRRGFSQEL